MRANPIDVTRRRFLKSAALGVGVMTFTVPRAGVAASRDRIVVFQGVGLDSLHPYAYSGGGISGIWQHVIEPLIEMDFSRKEYVGVLAESWDFQGRKWTFHLRRNVRFHDGSSLTSKDVLFSIDRMTHDRKSMQASNFAEVTGIEAPDDYTVVITTKQPNAVLLERLNNRFIISQSATEKTSNELDNYKIGTGPYKLKEWVRGQWFVVEKNVGYAHSDHRPMVDELVFRNIPESEVAITSLLNREVDVISNVAPESAARVTGPARIESARTINIMFLGMHNSVPQFKNKLVRQAVNYAIDRNALTKNVLRGYANPMDAPVGPDQYGYSREIHPHYTHDPAKAKKLLAQAGYPNGFEVEFLVPLGQYNKIKEVAEAIGSMLNEVGIRAKLHTQDQDSGFAAIQNGKVGMYIFGRGSVIDPSEYLHQYFRTGVTRRLEFSNPAVDAALQAEQASFDPAERVKFLQKAMSLLMDEAPMAWLYQYQGLQGVSNRFDFKANPGEDVYGWDLKPRAR